MKRVILDNGDGTVGVLIPAPKYLTQLLDTGLCDEHGSKILRSEDKALSILLAKDGGGKAGVIVDSVDIPQDRTFRNAWKPHANGVVIDMPRAQVIQMDRIREKRDNKLKELDIEQLKGNDVSAQKQVLRDIPSTFDLTTATTPEELKALWPTELEAE